MPDAVRAHEVVTDNAHIGRYRIERHLETNQTSELVLAVSEGAFGFERAVIIKRLLPHAHADPTQARSFAREASAYARLTHPAIVRLYDFLTINEMPAMVLEHVDGVSLQELLDRLRARGEKLPTEAALYVGARVFAALSAAHAACDPHTQAPSPIVHRDVCPGNVLIGTTGDVKLSNFGFAKLGGTGSTLQIHTDMNMQLPKGTLGHMAPEQLLGGAITPQTDVYLGALLVRELLVGEPAFVRHDEPYVDYLQSMAQPSLAPISAACPGLARVVAGALQVALAAETAERRISAADVQRVLNAHRKDGRAKLNEVLARLELVQSGSAEEADDSSVTAPSLMRLEARARRARIAASIFALLALVSCTVAVRSVAPSEARARSPVTVRTALVEPTPAVAQRSPGEPIGVLPPTPTPPNDPPPAVLIADAPPPTTPPATTGELQTSASTPPHRVFVDGHLVGESGATFTLSCGEHRVRIGGAGKPQSVVVPCGGNAVVATR